jgi:pSer/pThr/pTyr-binding forkhead associated (FHA) protein
MTVVCQNAECPYKGEPLFGLQEGDYCPYCGTPLSLNVGSQNAVDQIETASKPTLNFIHSSQQKINIFDPNTKSEKISIGRFDDSTEIYLGRFDEQKQGSTSIDINLKRFPNSHLVSRSHAYLIWDSSKNAYCLIDNKSSNKTLLNEIQLNPLQPYPLQGGDQIKFGNNGVVFTVEIIP